jgi:putative peptidoglycan lipid II flippase
VLCLPAAVGQAAAALPLVETLFQRGAFGPAGTAGTAAALAAYALGLPAFVLVKVFAPGFFARGDTATPVRIGVATVVVNIALNLLLSAWFSHVGVALATTLSAWFNALLLGGMLMKRRQLLPDRRLRRRVPRLLSAALLMGAALTVGERLLFPAASGPLRLLALAALVGGGAAVYFGAAHLFRGFDLRELGAILRRRRPPGAAPAAA